MISEFEQLMFKWTTMNGWTPENKIRDMVKLVLQEKPTLCVEIGTYAGRSFLPVAWAMKQNGVGGKAIGIDPYEPLACTEGWPRDQDHTGWDTNDLKPYHDELVDTAAWQGLTEWIDVRVAKSVDVVETVADGTVDILHIDGNHSELSALVDVYAWLPKMKPRGWIWADDAHMPTTKKAFGVLDIKCDLIQNYPDPRAGHPSWFRLYRKK
jgi:predicted O-methyltransferase YrrM